MKVEAQIDQLREVISRYKENNPNAIIGFVPTMGALHEGHLNLIETAKQQCDFVVCSIFVNPTQFNDSKDLDRYPRNKEADQLLLESVNCDLLFYPTEDEIYPGGVPNYKIDFQGLDKVMEGAFRDNHFQGVAMVVERLFEIVNPDRAFFGLKDFQQVAIIKHMVRLRNIDIDIIPLPIVRSKEGLALSSRNQLLNASEKKDALIIVQTLNHAKEQWNDQGSVESFKQMLTDFFNKGNLRLEYLEIVDNETLQPITEKQKNVSCCIAAYCGEVRLIDNIQIS